MTFNLLIVVLGLFGILVLIGSVRNFRRGRIGSGAIRAVAAVVLFILAAGALAVAANLRTFQPIHAERDAGELQFTRIGYHQFNGVFTFPGGERADFALRGDEWEMDARILTWKPIANLVGFKAAYRLDRISGRYTRLEDEQRLPRTVYALSQPDQFDLWTFLHEHQAWIPWIDAVYGTAAYLPMADEARYAIRVSDTGLLARPLNQPARAALGNWH